MGGALLDSLKTKQSLTVSHLIQLRTRARLATRQVRPTRQVRTTGPSSSHPPLLSSSSWSTREKEASKQVILGLRLPTRHQQNNTLYLHPPKKEEEKTKERQVRILPAKMTETTLAS